MTRGALAAGAIRTYVLYDRLTRASCFVCKDAGDAVALARWVQSELPKCREWLEASTDASLSKRAKRRVSRRTSSVRCATCSGSGRRRRRWAEHDDAQLLRPEHGLRDAGAPVKPERAISKRTWAATRKPSAEYFQSGHGKTVLAEAFLSDEQIRRVLRTTAEDLEALSWAGTHGSVASGMQSVAFTPASAIAAVFAATDRISDGRTSSMAQGTARRVEGGLQATIRFGGLEVGTVGGGTTLPSARDWLASIDCAGSARSTAFAQIIAPRRSASRSAPRRRWPRPGARTSSRRTTSAGAFVDACNSLLQARAHRQTRTPALVTVCYLLGGGLR